MPTRLTLAYVAGQSLVRLHGNTRLTVAIV